MAQTFFQVISSVWQMAKMGSPQGKALLKGLDDNFTEVYTTTVEHEERLDELEEMIITFSFKL